MKSLNFKLSGVAILLPSAVRGWAGQPEDTKVVVEPSPKPTAPWEIRPSPRRPERAEADVWRVRNEI
jgi:hypothetical protein